MCTVPGVWSQPKAVALLRHRRTLEVDVERGAVPHDDLDETIAQRRHRLQREYDVAAKEPRYQAMRDPEPPVCAMLNQRVVRLRPTD
jgi:hypothetical protein